MTVETAESLAAGKCRPCEGGIEQLSREQAESEIHVLSDWRLAQDGLRIEKHWHLKNFAACIEFFNRVAELAEQEGHHPDLHLTGYSHVWIELSTHAIGGLSQNDFILAAKIDRLPVRLKVQAL
jgi:4a-hydroxytetrahydrobiopterin dehydratase